LIKENGSRIMERRKRFMKNFARNIKKMATIEMTIAMSG
jgi:hypothetical protein